MSGVSGGWLTWIAITGLAMAVVCFLISLATRHFFSGMPLVLVTTSLMFVLVLVGLGSGMARSDFKLEVLFPYALMASAITGVWLLCMKARLRRH